MDVSDRRMQVQLTQEAKIASDFLYIRAIFAVVGFVSALSAPAMAGALCNRAAEPGLTRCLPPFLWGAVHIHAVMSRIK